MVAKVRAHPALLPQAEDPVERVGGEQRREQQDGQPALAPLGVGRQRERPTREDFEHGGHRQAPFAAIESLIVKLATKRAWDSQALVP